MLTTLRSITVYNGNGVFWQAIVAGPAFATEDACELYASLLPFGIIFSENGILYQENRYHAHLRPARDGNGVFLKWQSGDIIVAIAEGLDTFNNLNKTSDLRIVGNFPIGAIRQEKYGAPIRFHPNSKFVANNIVLISAGTQGVPTEDELPTWYDTPPGGGASWEPLSGKLPISHETAYAQEAHYRQTLKLVNGTFRALINLSADSSISEMCGEYLLGSQGGTGGSHSSEAILQFITADSAQLKALPQTFADVTTGLELGPENRGPAFGTGMKHTGFYARKGHILRHTFVKTAF